MHPFRLPVRSPRSGTTSTPHALTARELGPREPRKTGTLLWRGWVGFDCRPHRSPKRCPDSSSRSSLSEGSRTA
eukprot:702714-Prymnesium_polylepis.1